MENSFNLKISVTTFYIHMVSAPQKSSHELVKKIRAGLTFSDHESRELERDDYEHVLEVLFNFMITVDWDREHIRKMNVWKLC